MIPSCRDVLGGENRVAQGRREGQYQLILGRPRTSCKANALQRSREDLLSKQVSRGCEGSQPQPHHKLQGECLAAVRRRPAIQQVKSGQSAPAGRPGAREFGINRLGDGADGEPHCHSSRHCPPQRSPSAPCRFGSRCAVGCLVPVCAARRVTSLGASSRGPSRLSLRRRTSHLEGARVRQPSCLSG